MLIEVRTNDNTNTRTQLWACVLLLRLSLALFPSQVSAQASAAAPAPGVQAFAERDGARDFDFEFGTWKAHLSRRLHPLTGSTTWVEYQGISVVRPVWNGRANLGEIEVDGTAGHIEGLSLRLYNPETHQWNISWANSSTGLLGQAMVGGFKDGIGEFYDQETLNGRAIYVRFVFSDITAKSFKLEQAFSDDGGKTWEVNWISKFSR